MTINLMHIVYFFAGVGTLVSIVFLTFVCYFFGEWVALVAEEKRRLKLWKK